MAAFDAPQAAATTQAPTLSADEFAARRRALMDAVGSDAVVIVPSSVEQVRNRDVHYPFRQDSDFRYLTGFNEPDALLVLAPGHTEGEYHVFCRPRDREREIWDGLRAGPEGVMERHGADQGHTLDAIDTVVARLLRGRARIVYTLGASVAWDQRVLGWINGLRAASRRGPAAPESIVSLEASLHEQRLIKSPAELAMMAHASRVSAEAHCRAMRACKPGMTEYQVAAEIHHEFAMARMEPAYESIVGGGANACILHYRENNAVLREGELLLIDAGAEYDGYCADITRTFPVNGRFSGEQRAIYDIVLEAQLASIGAVRAGKRHQDDVHMASVRTITQGLVDLGLLKGAVDALIEDEAYKTYFMHGTGHWIGMDVHDVGAYYDDGQSRSLEPGMVLTVEPGIYVSAGTAGADERFWDIGVRIEDDVVVTDAAPRILTADVPKRAEEIEALMAD
ncbi:MAG: aminopeptidase P N-terminal domain-containing protein [Pseudomonadota bacterium]|nr:aminopeptidase P N-terminal domain-containing protein [Pseudomonadota bacterium]